MRAAIKNYTLTEITLQVFCKQFRWFHNNSFISIIGKFRLDQVVFEFEVNVNRDQTQMIYKNKAFFEIHQYRSLLQ